MFTGTIINHDDWCYDRAAMSCIVCTTEAFRGMPMNDKDLLAQAAQEIIQGLVTGMASTTLKNNGMVENFQMPPRRGTCIVERCARAIEAPCEGCRKVDCHRCAIAAELRSAEGRINAERDAEIADLGLDDEALEAFVDKLVESLCTDHAAFGSALAGQWYSRRSFLAATDATLHGP